MSTVKNTILILLSGFLISCSTKEKDSGQLKSGATPIPFSGYWLSKEYSETINSFKSPKKAQDNSEFIFIPDSTLKQTIMIYNFHEGGPYLTVLKDADQYELWETEGDSLIQRAGDIEIIDTNNIRIGKKDFVKIYPLQKGNESRVLEEILFKGIYTNASGATIEFKNNGEVSGLNNFKIYYPVIDYIDAGMQVDQIGLGNTDKDLKYFAFKFRQDTLELYQLKCLNFDNSEDRCVEVDFGQMVHRLWKKK